MDLKGKTVLLTGASGGIGQAVARELDKAGAKLILLGRNKKSLAELKNSLAGKHAILEADITRSVDIGRVKSVCERVGGIDVLINNAGISNLALLDERSPDELEQEIAINLLAPMQLCQTFLPMLKQRSEAAIVNVGSAFGSIGYPAYSAYCASKFGLRGFTESLRRELADSNIRVMYFSPRATETTINSDKVIAMNKALGNAVDKPEWVAQQLLAQIEQEQPVRYLGWPEKLFVRVNALLPGAVDGALKKQLPVIKRFAAQKA